MSGTNGSYMTNDGVVAELEKATGLCTYTTGTDVDYIERDTPMYEYEYPAGISRFVYAAPAYNVNGEVQINVVSGGFVGVAVRYARVNDADADISTTAWTTVADNSYNDTGTQLLLAPTEGPAFSHLVVEFDGGAGGIGNYNGAINTWIKFADISGSTSTTVEEAYFRTQGSQCEHDFIASQFAAVTDGLAAVKNAVAANTPAAPVDYTQLLTDIKTSVANIDTDTDKLTDILAAVDDLEALVTTSNVNTAATVAALGTILVQAQAINANTDTLETVLGNAVTQLQAINANTDQIEPKLDSIIALLTPSAKSLKTGGTNIAAGTFAGAAAYGTVASPPAVSGVLQSYTVTVVKSSGAPLAGNAVRVVTDQGTFYLVEGMSQSFSVAQDSQNKAEQLATAMNITALGNSAAVVTWTYE